MGPVTCSTQVESSVKSKCAETFKRQDCNVVISGCASSGPPGGTIYIKGNPLCQRGNMVTGQRSPLDDYFNFQGKNKD